MTASGVSWPSRVLGSALRSAAQAVAPPVLLAARAPGQDGGRLRSVGDAPTSGAVGVLGQAA